MSALNASASSDTNRREGGSKHTIDADAIGTRGRLASYRFILGQQAQGTI